MNGSTNADSTELVQMDLGVYTTPLTTSNSITATKSGIVLARVYGSSGGGMVYIRIDSASNIEQRQYGSYLTPGQQLMVPGFVKKDEKIRVTGADGATCILYLITTG